MFRGLLTPPFHMPNNGLEMSVSNGPYPKHWFEQVKVCQFQILKNSARIWKFTRSVILVSLMSPMLWLWKPKPRRFSILAPWP